MGLPRLRSGKRRGRGKPREVQRGELRKKICKWEDQEVKELSRLIFRYVQRSGGKLPRKSDAAFWALCCECFQGRFTALQVHDKARSLKLRFLRLSSDHRTKAIKLREHDIFQMWSQIMNFSAPGTNGMKCPSKGNTPGVGSAGIACKEEQDTSTCSTENMFEECQYTHCGDNGACTMHTTDVGHSAHNMTLLQHFIVADLASTTKTLANFVNSQAMA